MSERKRSGENVRCGKCGEVYWVAARNWMRGLWCGDVVWTANVTRRCGFRQKFISGEKV